MATVPVYQEYMQSILDVLRSHEGALPIEKLDRLVIEAMKLPPDVVEVPHDPERGDTSEVVYRMAWARTYLKKAGLLETPKRGHWAISASGRSAGTIDPYALTSAIGKTYRTTETGTESPGEEASDGEAAGDDDLTTARVGPVLQKQLLELHEKLATNGALLAPDVAMACLQRFREVFGPEVLAGLDGEALLLKMHARNTKDSLVYWLEFKDDDEMRAQFGSIGGGSALKFGIYQAAETGHWISGTSAKQRRLELNEAIAIARSQRDQLVACARVLQGLPSDVTAIDYEELQASLEAAAPDLAETSWGHKYLALLFPNVLPPIHGTGYQHHQLHKMLKVPAKGRYENARIFGGVARQLGISLHDLATTLHQRNGASYRYWRIGTTIGNKSEWERMRLGGFAAVGWDRLGDLSAVPHGPEGRAQIRAAVEAQYPAEAGVVTREANQLFNFIANAEERDVVVAMEGARVLGIGTIAGGYLYQDGDGPAPHRRPVKWLRTGTWKLPEMEGLRTTFVPLRKPRNLVDVEGRLLGEQPEKVRGSASTAPPSNGSAGPKGNGAAVPDGPQPLAPLTGTIARINAVLQRKRQVILYGPPGTGKTFWAERAVEQLVSRAWFSRDTIDGPQRDEVRKAGAIEMCSFHPAFGYEDFLEGYRPAEKAGSLTFGLRDGIFKKLCDRAAKDTRRPYFLIIDEINRGDIPRIFGELLTVLEREKRGKTITLPLSGTAFAVPDNVYVIGTMNTADRSIALLDAALRRRFGFVELLPDSSLLSGVVVGGVPLGPWLDELNQRIVKHAGREGRHLQVGHSYLLPSGAPVRELSRFAEILRDDIVPLLEEYCYGDMETLERILGSGIVQRAKQRIDIDLFLPDRHADLAEKLLVAFEGITALSAAVEAPEDDADADSEQDAALPESELDLGADGADA